jgi:hypothetical protein
MGWRAVRLRALYLAQINPYLNPLSDGEQHLPSAGCACSRHAIALVADPSIHEANGQRLNGRRKELNIGGIGKTKHSMSAASPNSYSL